jgi:hypothetical protein
MARTPIKGLPAPIKRLVNGGGRVSGGHIIVRGGLFALHREGFGAAGGAFAIRPGGPAAGAALDSRLRRAHDLLRDLVRFLLVDVARAVDR